MEERKETIIGTRIGIYDVLYECDFKSNDGHRMFHVKCSECSWETNMQMHQIKYVKKCNHLDRFGNYIVKYYWKHKELRSIFKGMEDRCYNKNSKDYCRYGGKGIEIAEEWIKDNASFELWSEENGWRPGLTIDRIDSDKWYSPENCQWVTKEDNSRYKSDTRIIEVDGIYKTGNEWSVYLKLGKNTINDMLRKNTEQTVKRFIKARIKNPNKKLQKCSWLKTYNIL